jgi:membrane protein
VARRGGMAGWPLQLAVEVLQHLDRAKHRPAKGLGAAELVARMRIDALQIAPVLETLVDIDWIAPLAEEPDNDDPRYILLADPAITPLEPLLKELLMPQAPPLEGLWRKGPLDALLLQDLLPTR